MADVGAWWDHLATMTRQALRAWWRLLPMLLGLAMLGWALFEVSVLLAASISARWPWVALFTLSAGLVARLATIIVSLRLLGRELGIRDQLPDGSLHDTADQSASRLLAVTLLPFLGIYATFGHVQDAANRMVAFEVVTRGLGSKSVMAAMSPHSQREWLVLAAVVAGAYLTRRVVDLLHERTDIRLFGLVAALLEGFFMLVFLFSGTRLLLNARVWLLTTRLASWGQEALAGWRTSADAIAGFLPDLTTWLWTQWWQVAWPLLTAALFEPLVWLAVAALVYGSHVLSLAEMWRKGEPMTMHLDQQRTIVLSKRARLRQAHGNSALRRGWLEIQEAFFSDIDDKYLPTFQSLRLVLSGGLVFLSAYVIGYALFASVSDLLLRLVLWLVGGGREVFWVAWMRVINAATVPIGETLRLSLLAVAFARTMQIFRSTADPSAVRVDAPLMPAVADAASLDAPVVVTQRGGTSEVGS